MFYGSIAYPVPRARYSRTRISAQNAYQLFEHTPTWKLTTQNCVASLCGGVCYNNWYAFCALIRIWLYSLFRLNDSRHSGTRSLMLMNWSFLCMAALPEIAIVHKSSTTVTIGYKGILRAAKIFPYKRFSHISDFSVFRVFSYTVRNLQCSVLCKRIFTL